MAQQVICSTLVFIHFAGNAGHFSYSMIKKNVNRYNIYFLVTLKSLSITYKRNNMKHVQQHF